MAVGMMGWQWVVMGFYEVSQAIVNGKVYGQPAADFWAVQRGPGYFAAVDHVQSIAAGPGIETICSCHHRITLEHQGPSLLLHVELWLLICDDNLMSIN